MELVYELLIFLGTAIIVVLAGTALAASGDTIASRTGWGRVWVGTLLLAGATSLPEMVTTISAVNIGAPNMAVGNVMGANLLNNTKLALLISVFGGIAFQRLSSNQISFAIMALILTTFATLMAALGINVKWSTISVGSIVILIIYLFGSWMLFNRTGSPTEDERNNIYVMSHKRAWGIFVCSAIAILLSAPFVATSAQNITEIVGISESFMGMIALAFVTSLPELSAIVAALRIRAPDLAVATVYGSNSFNIVALSIADFFYPEQSLFGVLGTGVVFAGVFAITLMLLGVIQLMAKRPQPYFSVKEPSALGTLTLYLAALLVVFHIE